MECTYELEGDIVEGYVACEKCGRKYPILDGIPALFDDFTAYICARPKLGGRLMLGCKTSRMRRFLKDSLLRRSGDDIGVSEERWARIYRVNMRSAFYDLMDEKLGSARGKTALEHGCSVGSMSGRLGKRYQTVFGVDRSFDALLEAKKLDVENCHYVASDSLYHPFGRMRFEAVVSLNMLEIAEPRNLIQTMARQSSKLLLISDPYDYDRPGGIKNPVGPDELRELLKKHGFALSAGTKKQTYTTWNLRLNPRAQLCYKVDCILGKKRHRSM